MQPYIAVTHPKWFQFLRELAWKGGRLDEVDFWNRGGKKSLPLQSPGSPEEGGLFRLTGPLTSGGQRLAWGS
ncbi:MAG: hypothetical protein ACE5H3_05690 [Planctomycetota bacterium]